MTNERSAVGDKFTGRRFAILIHDHPFVHWDLLIEEGEIALTWRLLESPERWLLAHEKVTICADQITPHRLLYFDYEGPVSRERGAVVRWDGGTISSWTQGGDLIEVGLNGSKLIGQLRLSHRDSWQEKVDFRSESATPQRTEFLIDESAFMPAAAPLSRRSRTKD